ADGEVEAADQEHEREPDAEDQERRVCLEDVEEVRPREELRLQVREDPDEDQQYRQDADVLERRLLQPDGVTVEADYVLARASALRRRRRLGRRLRGLRLRRLH